MLPSEFDRRSWIIIGLWIGGLLVISILAGAGNWLLDIAAPKVDQALTAIAVVLAISDIIHLVLLIPIWIFRLFLRKITGYEVYTL